MNAELRFAEVMKRMQMRAWFVLSAGAGRLVTLVCLSLAMLGVALADESDPPGRVARLSYLQGSVSLEPAGAQDWVGAEINRPLTINDKVWSDVPGSRAELDMGGAVVRLGSNTGFSFLNLDDNIAQMQVTTGTVVVHVRELLENQTYEIDTPNLAVLLDQPGQYRVDVNESGNTTVVRVSDGHAEASNGGDSMPIANQQMVTFTGTEDQVSASTATLGAPDGFDDWSFERDREYERAASRQYVGDGVVGTEDLDDNGEWQSTPDYGNVWVPTVVAAGWAPYSFGHWAWVSPWGWTWIDDAPWGYAPFHYGRWARWHDSWCWVPGPRQVRPVYSPAMVAWVGGGAGGVAVGWFPLGPREVFVPGYRVSDRYVRTINVTNTTIVNQTYITNVYQSRGANVRYVNSAIPGAVTTVPRNVFTSAQPVSGHRMSAPEGGPGRFATTGAPPAIAPARQSVLGSTRVAARQPPQAFVNRTVVARTPPPAAASSARVRLVAPPERQAGRGPGFNGSPGPNRPGPGFNRPEPGGQQPGQAGAGFNRSEPGAQRPGQAGFNRSEPGGQQPGQAGSVQSRQPAPAAPSAQRRPEVSQQPAPETDTRSWAERAHALEQHALPPTQGPRNDRPYSPPPPPREYSDGTSDPRRYQPGGPTGQPNTITRERDGQTFRPPQQPSFGGQAGQSGRVEQERPPVNNSYRPPVDERRSAPEQRFNAPAPPEAPVPHFNAPAPPEAPVPHFNAPAPPEAPVPHFNAPAPPPAPVPHYNAPAPPPAPVPTAPRAAPPQQQHPQPSNRGEERPPPRTNGRPDPQH